MNRKLLRQKRRAIAMAEDGYRVSGKRHYVIHLIDRYEVVSSVDVKQINRMLPKNERWGYIKIMSNCVYHTK